MNSEALRIRPAEPGDVAALAALCGQLGYPSTVDETARRLARLLEEIRSVPSAPPAANGRSALFVAESGNTVVGWVHVFRQALLESDGEAEIGGLVVDEGHRGQGFGRALMDRAEAWAKEAGCRAVRLRSNVIRARAHAFYEARGYERVKSQHVYRRPLGAGTEDRG